MKIGGNCPIKKIVLRELGLDKNEWKRIILAPIMEFILADQEVSDEEKAFLRKHKFTPGGTQRDYFLDKLCNDMQFRHKTMGHLRVALGMVNREEREFLLSMIDEGIQELMKGPQSDRDSGKPRVIVYKHEDLLAVRDIYEEIGQSSRAFQVLGTVSAFLDQLPDFEEKESVSTKDSPQALEEMSEPKLSDVPVDSAAHEMWEAISGRLTCLSDCLQTLQKFKVSLQTEDEKSTATKTDLIERVVTDELYIHNGIGVMPAPEADAPLYIIGDLHGDYDVLQAVLSRTEFLTDESVKLVFLGDYIDRGRGSLPILFRLMELKLAHWDRIILLRGNHEILGQAETEDGKTAWVPGTGNGEFVADVKRSHQHDQKAMDETFTNFHEVFTRLPHFLIIGKDLAVSHSGVVPRFPDEDPLKGNIEDDLRQEYLVETWADLAKPKVKHLLLWARCDWKPQLSHIWNGNNIAYKYFDYGDVAAFLKRLGLRYLVRGHDHPAEGYKFSEDCPQMVTLCTSTVMNTGAHICVPHIARFVAGEYPRPVKL